jgi:hexosaminidase
MSNRYATLVPKARHATKADGTFTLGPDTPLCVAPGAEAAGDAVRLLLAPLRLPLRLGADAEGALSVEFDRAITEPEGYRLTVAPTGIQIAAAGIDGARHAVQTLRQLLSDNAWRLTALPGTRWTVDCGEVIDAPVLGWRGGMLDVSRHFLPKRALLRYVDLFAMHRLNRLHLHLTDDQGWRIESRRYPELNKFGTHRPETMSGRYRHDPVFDGTPHGGYYTLDDLAEVAAYAAERGITVVPEIDLPGHASALITAFPELGTGGAGVLKGWGISAGILKPIPAAVDLVCALLDELLEAVPTPYVHLGGDECVMKDWPGDPDVSVHMEKLNTTKPADLHGWFLREIAEHLSSKGKRMVVWDEAFQTGGVREDTIVMCWRGDAIAREAAAAGYDVVRAPVYPTYLDYDQSDLETEQLAIGGPITLADSADFTPLREDWTEAELAHVLGGQFQTWSEYIPNERHLDYMVFPRACAIAEATWLGGPADYDDLTGRLESAHLARLDAAGVEYRPLDGPRPWQQGGTGARKHVDGRRYTPESWRAQTDETPESGESEAETVG